MRIHHITLRAPPARHTRTLLYLACADTPRNPSEDN